MPVDEICTICKEPKSAHVSTEQGPYTHPREARGEGIYTLEGSGTQGFGLDCSICHGPCNHHVWQKWVFKPYNTPTTEKVTQKEASTIVEMKVTSPPNATVKETVVVLSEAAQKRLVIQGDVPARDTRKDTSPGSDTHCMACGNSKRP